MKHIIALCIAFIVLATACTVQQSEQVDEFQSFFELQEQLVDSEAERQELQTELAFIQRDLHDARQQVEQVNEQDDFIQELFGQELPSPQDRIGEQQIRVSKNRVTIDIRNAMRAGVLDTNSMDPVLDEESTAILIRPQKPEEIEVGDIVVFDNKDSEPFIVHRVVRITQDEKGIRFHTKGDNAPVEDPFDVRFENIEAIVVGILY